MSRLPSFLHPTIIHTYFVGHCVTNGKNGTKFADNNLCGYWCQATNHNGENTGRLYKLMPNDEKQSAQACEYQ